MRLVSYILVLFILCSCGSSKYTLEQKTVNKTKSKTDEATEKITESVNDTLQGSVPIPQLGYKPVDFNFGSSGTQLQLRLTDGKIAYKAISKANTKTIERTKKKEDVQHNETNELETETKKKNFHIPWWFSGAILLVIIVVIQLFKRKFKIIRI